MIVAGVMSGTSADGIDVALVRLGERPGHGFELLGHAEYPYPKKVRAAVLAAMNAPQASVADLSRLNFLLGELYSEAVLATERQFRVKAGSGRLPRANALSSRRAAALSRAQAGSHLADRRGGDHRRESRRARGFRFSSGGYRGWRQRRAAGSLPRLHAIPRRTPRKNRAKHRRHRKPYRHPRESGCERCNRVRYRPRQHGDRRRHREAVRPTVRSRRQNCSFREGAR